jgi:hypothetical protein
MKFLSLIILLIIGLVLACNAQKDSQSSEEQSNDSHASLEENVFFPKQQELKSQLNSTLRNLVKRQIGYW